MNKVFEILLPFLANAQDNRKIYKKLSCESNMESILNKKINSEKLDIEILKDYYAETFLAKDKLEDKAKNSIIGITLTITLILNGANMLTAIINKYPYPFMKWISFFLLAISVLYMLVAGLLSIRVINEENTVHTISLESLAKGGKILRDEYDLRIVQNRYRNLIRNNGIYTSYECIRNALLCLFFILLLSIIPINLTLNTGILSSMPQQNTSSGYSFSYSSSTVDYLLNNDVQDLIENKVLNTINQGVLTNSQNSTFGLIDETTHLFIKINVDQNDITVLLIEPYNAP